MTEQDTIQFRDYLSIVGFTLLFLLAIPIIAIVGLTMQFSFLVIAPILLLAAVIYSFGRKSVAGVHRVRGIDMPSDLFFTRKHLWFKKTLKNNILVGLDDFAQRILGKPLKIEMVKAGRQLNKGDTLATIKLGHQSITIPSPCKGQVLRTNHNLETHPDMLNQSPYNQAWLAEVNPEGMVLDLKDILSGETALIWMRTEIDRMISMLNHIPTQIASPHDGSEVAPHFTEHLDEDTRNRMLRDLIG